mgnify:FL=1
MPVFRGWVVVWAAFACMTVIFGVAYSFAAFFAAFELEFAAQRADVSLVFGLASLLYFGLGAFGGIASDRWGPRVVGVAGMLLIAAGLLVASFAQSLPVVYAGYGIGVGLGIALVYTPSMGAVQPWFLRRRGLASGVASAGIGMGTFALPLVATALIDAGGWRQAMQWLAAIALVAGVAAAWRLERDPQRYNLWPDGDAAPPGAPASGAGPNGLAMREILRTRSFRWMYASLMVAGIPMFVPFAHLSAGARDAGIAEAPAVALVGVIGIGSLIGRFGVGTLADRFGRLESRVAVELMVGASMLVWLAAQYTGSYLVFMLFALLFGFSYGGIVSLLPPIVSDLYGTRAVAGGIGVLYSAAAFGSLVGPVVAGAVFDTTGAYDIALLGGMACSGFSAYCAFTVARMAARGEGAR